MALACASTFGYAMNPPCANGLVGFQVRRFFEGVGIRLAGMMLLGKGAALPGARMARVTAGLASEGYQRLPRCRISDKSPARMSSVGTEVTAGVARLSSRASQLNSQNVLFRMTGPDTTPPYWFRRSLFLACSGGRKYPRASNRSFRTNSNRLAWSRFVPDLIATLTCAPEAMPYSAE